VEHCRFGRHPTGHVDACGAASVRPFGRDGQERLYAELLVSGLRVALLLGRLYGLERRLACRGCASQRRVCPSGKAAGCWAFSKSRFAQLSWLFVTRA